MARTVMVLNNPLLKVAETAAELATGLAVECQVNEFRVQSVAKYNTIPATGCAGETQSPGTSGYQALITWLQDWSAGAAASLSWFAWEHDGQQVAFELTPNSADTTTKITGDAYCVSGSFGGVFGDGSAAQSDQQTWPLVAKPTILTPVAADTADTAAAAGSPIARPAAV